MFSLLGLLFILAVLGGLYAFFRFYVVPNGLRGEEPDSLNAALNIRTVENMTDKQYNSYFGRG